MLFGGGLWDTATDVSSIGETRRGCEGESWDISLGPEVVFVRDCDFESLCELLLWSGGRPSDNRESASMHASRSSSDVGLSSRPGLLFNKGICVTNETGSGRTGGG